MAIADRLSGLRSTVAVIAGRVLWRALPRSAKSRFAQRVIVLGAAPRVKRFLRVVERRANLVAAVPSRPVVPELLRTGKSLIRFADGEAAVLCGRSIWQVADPSPAVRGALYELFFGYSERSSYLLAASTKYILTPPAAEARREGHDVWERLRALLALALDIEPDRPAYFESQAFRERDEGTTKEDPSPLWESASDIVLVTNARVVERVKSAGTFGNRRIHVVHVPEREAVAVVGAVVQSVEGVFRDNGLAPRSAPVIVGAGVAGKLIVRDLMADHRAYDLGAYRPEASGRPPWGTVAAFRLTILKDRGGVSR